MRPSIKAHVRHWTHDPAPRDTRRVKILEVTNVDFSLRHFLLPLMRGAARARARGGGRLRGRAAAGRRAGGGLPGRAAAAGAQPVAGGAVPGAPGACCALLRAERPDMVHAHMPISGFLARLAARLRRRAALIAYTCHGFLFNQPGPLPRRAARLAMEWVGGRHDRHCIMTVSTEEAADARRLGIARRAVAVGNGRDPARFRPNPAARARIRAELGRAGDRGGRHRRLAPGAAQGLSASCSRRCARCRGPSCGWWASGWPPTTARTWSRCSPQPASARGCAGSATATDVPAVLAASDIFALPSHFEGLPMSVIEAMLTGLPVVATDIRGPREQVVDGETGLLVPPATVAAAGRRAAPPGRRPGAARAHGRGRARARGSMLYDEAQVVGAHAGPAGAVAPKRTHTAIAA